ncbi:MAG: hypothetical protein U0X91_32055 [Spirosomataceae bacterium]
MKKIGFFFLLWVTSSGVRADEVDVAVVPGQPVTKWLLTVGIVALGLLFYIRYRRARNRSSRS